MYKNFFDFKERPFQLVPNPAYLFLSRSHEEALAHLSFSMDQGDGFVEITGEVGTGKTTLCRAFLENLGQDIEIAYIFNPKLDSIQLIKAINDEFGINSDSENSKILIDTLNRFLLDKKAEGKKVILLIDEAQNLTMEVLEQLRLLSNLETTTSKLLQIILVGQPELGDLLDSYELRQLSQRITLSCHITPMTYKETRDYILHRIEIASQKPGVKFTSGAFRSFYKYSKGIPRLINIACDRALLNAFVMNQKKITGKIAGNAINELAGRGDAKRNILKAGKPSLIFASTLLLVLIVAGTYYFKGNNIDAFVKSTPKEKISIGNIDEPIQELNKTQSLAMNLNAHENDHEEIPLSIESDSSELKTNPRETIISAGLEQQNNTNNKSLPENIHSVSGSDSSLDADALFQNISSGSSRSDAFKTTMDLWDKKPDISPYLENIDDDHDFFRLAAKQSGFMLYRIDNNFRLVKKLNIPAILKLYSPNKNSHEYVTLTGINGNRVFLLSSSKQKTIEINIEKIKEYWLGTAYIPWKNHLNLTGVIPFNASRDSILALKLFLRDIGFSEIDISPFYDEMTKEAVKKIQLKNSLDADGIVGPLTKIILYNEKESFYIPLLGFENN